MKNILISDAVDKKCIAVLERSSFKVDYKPGISADELKSIIKNYNGLIVRSDTQVTSELINLMDKMEVIGRAGTGVDNIDVKAATRKGIIVMNTPGGNTISAAEHTIALMLSMCRNIPLANQSLKEGKWERKKFKGIELHGKTLGIIGLGKIGREVAGRAASFGMNILGFDPILSAEIASEIGINLVDLNTIFEKADFITVHVPLNSETKNLLNRDTLKKCKDGVRIINCARGGIIDEIALADALKKGKVASAAFDVYVNEPPGNSNPLVNHPAVVATPHLGASTEEAQAKVAVQIAEQFSDLFINKKMIGAINASGLSGLTDDKISPYLDLAESIGVFHAQILKGKLKEININYSGELLHKYSSVLKAAVLKGFLSQKLNEPVNFINVPVLSAERGVVVNEIHSGSHSTYSNLLSVQFSSEKSSRTISGTVFGNKELRIVGIDQYHIELKPEGNLVLYNNIDRPGMMATVGKILAEANINIAGLSLGRIEKGKDALTAISIDGTIDDNSLKKISRVQGLNNVMMININS